MDRDSSKILMFVSDGLECKGNPFSSPLSECKDHISELRCFREA